MLKIWAEDPKERARGVGITCGHMASPCGRPWAPRAREPSAPVGPMRPPRGGDVAAPDSLVNSLLSLLLSQPPSLHTCAIFEEHFISRISFSTIFAYLF